MIQAIMFAEGEKAENFQNFLCQKESVKLTAAKPC
jgi:hypothetical protein